LEQNKLNNHSTSPSF